MELMDIKGIISKKVSFQPNAWSSIEKEISIEEVIKDTKRGRYAEEVNKLRWYLHNDEKDKYDIHKKRLPGVTFCANFNGNRKKELIRTYHNLVVLDIDKLENKELRRVKNLLENDKYAFTFWVSPSEYGIKGLIYLEYKFEIKKYGIDLAHRHAFEQITEYFKDKYSIDLDTSGSDTTRLCFLSYDSDLLFKTSIIPFPIVEPNEDTSPLFNQPSEPKKKVTKIRYSSSKDVLNNPKGKNNQRDRRTLVNIIKFLKKENISITSTYENWYRVAYAIANSFTHDIGEKYFLSLCELDGVNHDENQSKNMLLYCYQNSNGNIKFKTIVFLATIKGYKIKGNST
ncbi:MAG: hypothetical protein FVQ77_06335 [Cytophagales bacterium]|nr:hypothetical protein [Cytophagales bacterium]